MKTPKAILDRIAHYEAKIAESQNEIARLGGVITELQQTMQAEQKRLDEWQGAIDQLRFAVAEYDAEAATRASASSSVGDGGGDGGNSDVPEESAGTLQGSIAKQVYDAMGWLPQPVHAKDVAAAIGVEWQQVAPTFGSLHKQGKVKPDPRGGWHRANVPDQVQQKEATDD